MIPTWTPDAREQDHLEVLTAGGYAPLRGFLGPDDLAAVGARGQLADGTAWPAPVSLAVPAELAAAASEAGSLRLLDDEGAPIGEVAVRQVWPLADGRFGVAGPVVGAAAPTTGGGPVLAVPFDRPLLAPDVAAIKAHAAGARVLLMPLSARSRSGPVDGPALVRSCRAAARELGADVRPVPLPPQADGARERLLRTLVARAYGAERVAVPGDPDLPDVALDRRTGGWAAGVPGEHAGDVPAADVAERVETRLAAGEPVPSWLADAAAVRELRRTYRPGGGRGFAVLFTGLSGSGKSTIARAVHAALLEGTDRSVTLLDGDVVRRMLASELGFSRAHRELNVRRIGWVAAEVAKHGGVALCAPIAPYAAMREEMRAMVSAGGGFLLVHVATPLEVCEARDRKGLYARARAGEIAGFTGISDPYEPPVDAELVIDAAQVPVVDAVARVLDAVGARGWLTKSSGEGER